MMTCLFPRISYSLLHIRNELDFVLKPVRKGLLLVLDFHKLLFAFLHACLCSAGASASLIKPWVCSMLIQFSFLRTLIWILLCSSLPRLKYRCLTVTEEMQEREAV